MKTDTNKIYPVVIYSRNTFIKFHFMKCIQSFFAGSAIVLLLILQACSSPGPASAKTDSDSTQFYTAADFTAVEKTDAHVHVQTRDSSFINQAINDNVNLFSIDYDDANEPPPMEMQEEWALFQQNKFPDRFQYATT